MGHRLVAGASALVLWGALVTVLAPACDLQYDCETVEPGGAGAGIPAGSVGAGDYLRDGEGGEGEDVESESLALMAGCSPSKDCYDMYADCEDIGGSCIRGFPGCDVHGSSACKSCFTACLSDVPYPPACNCSSCGFR